MRSAGPGGAVAFGLLAVLALATSASAGAVKTATPAAGASEEEPSGGGMYLVPRLGKHPVLGPVTGAPPGRVVHVPLSAPSVSVRRKDDSVAQPRQPEKRSLVSVPGSKDNQDFAVGHGDAYYEALLEAARRHPRRRKQRLSSRSLSQADVR